MLRWNHRDVSCDSCFGNVRGPRLICLDCVNKSTEVFSPLDLCCEQQCVSARVTHRQDLEGSHEPNHRLLKVRTSVVKRNYGIAYTKACGASERVRQSCREITKFSLQSRQEEMGLTKEEDDSESDKRGSDEQKIENFEPTSTKLPAKSDTPSDVATGPGHADAVTQAEAEVEDKTSRGAKLVQVQNENLPTRGQCKGRLRFPFWYCVFCTGLSQGQRSLVEH